MADTVRIGNTGCGANLKRGGMPAARGGSEGGRRNQNPAAILMLDGVQLKTGGAGKEGLDMAQERSHAPLDD